MNIFGFLTADANVGVATVHPKTMPVRAEWGLGASNMGACSAGWENTTRT
jgi:hypothetical protein